jgi:hypothetical protein
MIVMEPEKAQRRFVLTAGTSLRLFIVADVNGPPPAR